MGNIILSFRLGRQEKSRIGDFATPTIPKLVTPISPFCVLPWFRDDPYLDSNKDEFELRYENIQDTIRSVDGANYNSLSFLLNATDRAYSGWLWEGVAVQLQKANYYLNMTNMLLSSDMLGTLFELYTTGIQISGSRIFDEVLADRELDDQRRDPNLSFFDRFPGKKLRKAYTREIELASRYTRVPPIEKGYLS